MLGHKSKSRSKNDPFIEDLNINIEVVSRENKKSVKTPRKKSSYNKTHKTGDSFSRSKSREDSSVDNLIAPLLIRHFSSPTGKRRTLSEHDIDPEQQEQQKVKDDSSLLR